MGFADKLQAAKAKFNAKKSAFEKQRNQKKIDEIKRLKKIESKQRATKGLDKKLAKLREKTGKKPVAQRAGDLLDKASKFAGEGSKGSKRKPVEVKMFDSSSKGGGLTIGDGKQKKDSSELGGNLRI